MPGDELAPAESRSRDRGRLRASHSDREQIIGALKTAYVDGRLTRDEFGARVDQVYGSRTYAELAEAISDLPTPLTGARPPRAPWRATRRAWWFEYAAFLPGIVAVVLLPGGPHTTGWTLLFSASILYPVFWALGVGIRVASRYAKSLSPPSPAPLSWYERDHATRTLQAALTQGRLTEDEHDARTPEVNAARSRGELAALTADLPAHLIARLPTGRDAWTGICVCIAAVSVLSAVVLIQPDDFLAFATGILAAITVLLAPPVTVGLLVDARHQKRARTQLRLGTTT